MMSERRIPYEARHFDGAKKSHPASILEQEELLDFLKHITLVLNRLRACLVGLSPVPRIKRDFLPATTLHTPIYF